MKNGIKKYRQKMGMSQAQLALELGVSSSAISNYETGIRTPEIELAFQFKELVGHKLKIKINLEDIYIQQNIPSKP